MTIAQNVEYLTSIVIGLVKLPLQNETEWVEFKHNNGDPEAIGEYISSLANAAALHEKAKAYMLWGVDDLSHVIVGTTFSPSKKKMGNEELENWLLRLLEPKIDFCFFVFKIEEHPIVLGPAGSFVHFEAVL
ncbi:MAG: hypothetical protein K1060chlam2_00998 [Chlamydiae bacterium]|nr:hypothetical protein [Chlamydiota bacterium]